MADITRRPSARQAIGQALRAQPADNGNGNGAVPPPVGATGPEREFTVEARAQWKTIARRFFRHKLAMTSLVILSVIVLVAFVGPTFWQWRYDEAVVANANQGPSWTHPFGTDDIGQDMFARVMRGAQRSLQIAFIVAFLSTTIGVTVGAFAGYFRGPVDWLAMRFTDLILTIPLLVLVATLARIVQGNAWYLIPVVLGLVAWTTMARIVRGEFLSLREKEFVEAARAVGAPDRRIIFKHIMPNLVGPIIVAATLTIAGAILTEAALSFLGLGVQPPDSSLGLLVSQYQAAFSTRPWLFWFPGVTILIIALCVNFIGDGLRDAFDPKQNRVRA